MSLKALLIVLGLPGALGARVLLAQTPMRDIIAADVVRHLEGVRADSLGDSRSDDPDRAPRDASVSPNSALERTVRYVATQFQAAGLKPIDSSGDWISRYPIPGTRRADPVASSLLFWAHARRGAKRVITERGYDIGQTLNLQFDTKAFFAVDTVLDPAAPGAQGSGQASLIAFDLVGPPPVVVAGPHTLASVRQANLSDQVVIYLPTPGGDTTIQSQITTMLRRANHLITVVPDEDSSNFSRRHTAAALPVFIEPYLQIAARPRHWSVVVWAGAIQNALTLAGLDWAAVRGAATPLVRELSAMVMIRPAAASPPPALTMPNVAGLLPGIDERRAIVITTPLVSRRVVPPTDRAAGSRTGEIGDRGDVNYTNVAALIALAQAFARAGARPARSLIFAAVSGEAPDFWGSHYFIDRWRQGWDRGIVADITLDQLLRGTGDSVWIDGLRDVALAVQPAWLAAQHPKLGLTVADGGTAVAQTSTRFAFMRRGVPSLSVRMSALADEASVAHRSVPEADAAARALQFLFYLTETLANAAEAPRWTAEGRQQRRLLGADAGEPAGD